MWVLCFNELIMWSNIHLSIHFLPPIGLYNGSMLNQVAPFLTTSFSSFWGIPRHPGSRLNGDLQYNHGACPWVFSYMDVLGIPPQGSIQETSWSDALTTSTGSFLKCECQSPSSVWLSELLILSLRVGQRLRAKINLLWSHSLLNDHKNIHLQQWIIELEFRQKCVKMYQNILKNCTGHSCSM